MNTSTLPDFDLVFGSQSYRLRGISSWEDVPILGKGNIECLRLLSQKTAMRLLGESGSRDDSREVQGAIRFLSDSLLSAGDKPLLPRLRVESFRKETVSVFISAIPPGRSRRARGSRRPSPK
jgi:hypothetical protein